MVDHTARKKFLCIFSPTTSVDAKYATCVYLMHQTLEGISIQSLNARNGVAPIKELTITLLEFLSCFIGAGLVKTITTDFRLEPKRLTFWKRFFNNFRVDLKKTILGSIPRIGGSSPESGEDLGTAIGFHK